MGGECLAYASIDPFEEFSQKAIAVFHEWLESLRPTIEAERKPDLRQLSDLFTKTRGDLLGGCLKAAIEEIYRPFFEEKKHSCEWCGKMLSAKRIASRKCSTMQGEFELERPYFYCETCKGWAGHPLDIAVGLARERHQYDVQWNMVQLAADLPYETSAAHFDRLTGVAAGAHFAFDTLNEVAGSAHLNAVVPKPEELSRRIHEATQASTPPPVMVIAIDGAHTPIRPPGKRKCKRGKGEWKETKGIRIYLATEDDRIIHLLSWHRTTDKKGFSSNLRTIARIMPDNGLEKVAVGDGAKWIWKLVQKHFPDARQVLDYYHCAEHIWTVANDLYEDRAAATEWVEATLARLSVGRVSAVLGGLKRMRPRTADAKEAVRKLIGYLAENRDRVAYSECSDHGIPKGSGAIESANKYIHHIRMKRSGAWWLKTNARSMLSIRCAVYNGTFNHVFDRHVVSQQELLNI